MNAATEHLIEAMRATKRGDDCEEAQDLHNAFRCSVETDNRCALDLNAILEALMEIVVGEKCIAVPVREVEALRAASSLYDLDEHLVYAPRLQTLLRAAEDIRERLPDTKVDHVARLMTMLALARRDGDKRDEAALEAAIEKMEKESTDA
mgnify:FL=1